MTDDPLKIAINDLKDTLNKYDKNSPAMKGVTSRTKKIFNGLRELTEDFQFVDVNDVNRRRPHN